jgi:hypothetical protein
LFLLVVLGFVDVIAGLSIRMRRRR